MNAKELFKPMLYSFFIIFSGSLICAFAIVHFNAELHRLTFLDMTGMFVLALLTNSTHLILYSKRTLSPGQITFRFILITPAVLIIIFFVGNYMGWVDHLAELDNNMVYVIVGLIFLITFVILIVDLSFMNEKLKSKAIMEEKDYYLHQYKVLQESMEQVSAVRHDMKSHLAIIRGYILENRDISDYLNKLFEEIEESEIYSDTGNVAFDSIINFKLARAKADNIKLDIDVKIPSELNMEVTDVAIIIGNLLDNALEAMSKIDDRALKLEIEYSKGILYIQVDNTFDGVVNYYNKKGRKEKSIITSKSHRSHGQGLKNVKKSVEKYNGHFDISHENKLFSVRVLLYVE